MRERAGLKPIGREGTDEGKWILLDFADIVVHVFQPEERDFYRLERLWGEAPHLRLPDSIDGAAEPTPGKTDDEVGSADALTDDAAD